MGWFGAEEKKELRKYGKQELNKGLKQAKQECGKFGDQLGNELGFLVTGSRKKDKTKCRCQRRSRW